MGWGIIDMQLVAQCMFADRADQKEIKGASTFKYFKCYALHNRKHPFLTLTQLWQSMESYSLAFYYL